MSASVKMATTILQCPNQRWLPRPHHHFGQSFGGQVTAPHDGGTARIVADLHFFLGNVEKSAHVAWALPVGLAFVFATTQQGHG